jgi:hypothetical protein
MTELDKQRQQLRGRQRAKVIMGWDSNLAKFEKDVAEFLNDFNVGDPIVSFSVDTRQSAATKFYALITYTDRGFVG